jgi:hypothetical protein
MFSLKKQVFCVPIFILLLKILLSSAGGPSIESSIISSSYSESSLESFFSLFSSTEKPLEKCPSCVKFKFSDKKCTCDNEETPKSKVKDGKTLYCCSNGKKQCPTCPDSVSPPDCYCLTELVTASDKDGEKACCK